MSELLYILEDISLPILLLIAAGFIFQKIFKTDVGTLTKLSLYLFIPVLVFIKLVESTITWDMLFQVVLFMLILQIVMYFLAILISSVLKYNKSKRAAVVNAMVMTNTGNYGIPLIDLTFQGNLIAITSQILIVILQNVTTSTLGVFQVSKANSSSRKESFKSMLKMPTIYVILLFIILKALGVKLPDTIKIPCDYISNGFVAIALTTLGMQLADVKFGKNLKDVIIISITRLIVTPVAAFGIVLLLGLKGVLAPALIIGVSTPTAVNTAILAKEFNSEVDFASQIVLLTTILCTFTLPVVILILKAYYGPALIP